MLKYKQDFEEQQDLEMDNSNEEKELEEEVWRQ